MDNNKKPICFVTNCSDSHYHSLGCDKLVKSAKYFYPEIPFFVLGTNEVNKLGGLDSFTMAKVMHQFIDEYQWVVRFDADSMITGPLDELFDAINSNQYDIIGVRNNNDYAKAGANEPITQKGIDTFEYLNAGFVATNSKAFIEGWMDCNAMFGHMCPFVEQSTLNSLSQKFKTLILDRKENPVFYGVAGLYGNGDENQTHWDSWREIIVAHGEFYLDGKKVKVIHHAGGSNDYKLGFHLFSDQARRRLIEIIEG
jgi:hypothetical protein